MKKPFAILGRTSPKTLLGLLVLAGLSTNGASLGPTGPQPQAANAAQTIDITGALLTNRSHDCRNYVAAYRSSAADINNRTRYAGSLTITLDGNHCVFSSNAVPNHDFNDRGRGFVNRFAEQIQVFRVPINPQRSSQPTALSLQYDNAIFLNGVKVDLLAAGCHGVADGKIGCNDVNTPWRYDPMGPGADFGTDSHNAHTQPDGTYHYHGNPKALFDDGDGSQPSPVIGFAADGFPIFGSFFDDNGTIRKARPSYQVRGGTRSSGPGGRHDGTFVDDFEYVPGSGDLDECNGMTVDGVYGYYVTESYPHILGCFSGTPDESFRKAAPGGGGQPGRPDQGTGQPSGSNQGPGGPGGGQRPGEPDLSAAAAELGVTEQQLRDALGPPPPDLEAAAAELGVTVEELRRVLPPPPGGGRPPRR